MAGASSLGRREGVQDPLAFNPGTASPDRSQQLVGVKNAKQTGGNAGAVQADALTQALGQVQSAVAGRIDAAADEATTAGKIMYMQGATAADVQATGNNHTTQGYETLSAADQANRWFATETANIDKQGAQMDPAAYGDYLMKQRSEQLKNLPADPAVRKVYAAAYEDIGPRLAAAQVKAHAAYNEKQTATSFSNLIESGSATAPDASQPAPGLTSLRVSATPIAPPVANAARDRDSGIRTILGEAGGEGEVGMAAVAQVIRNRVNDSRWGGSVESVVKAPKQFSAWNVGAGGIPSIKSISTDSPAYKRAGAIYDAVMSGSVVDMTNGATHYYSPAGMSLLQAQGAQGNSVPSWYSQEAAKGHVDIGGHRFAGKSNGAAGGTAQAQPAGLLEPGNIDAPLGIQSYTVEKDGGQVVIPGATPTGTQLTKDEAVSQFEKTGKHLGVYDTLDNAVRSSSVKPGDQINAPAGSDPSSVSKLAGTEPGSVRPGHTVTRELIMQFQGMKPEDKAVHVADLMRRQLGQGNDQAFNDLGGVQILRDLGAKPSDIDEVMKAKKGFDKAKLDSYSQERESAKAVLLANAKSGRYSLKEMQDQVTALQQSHTVNDSEAKSLAASVAQEAQKRGDNAAQLNPDLRDGIALIYNDVQNGTLTPHAAADKIAALSTQYNVDHGTSVGFVTKMYAADEARKAKERAVIEAQTKKQITEKGLKDDAETALKQGYGLKQLAGSVHMTDAQGNETEGSIQDWAIAQLKDRETARVKDMVARKEISPEIGAAMIDKSVYENLAKHDVVDKDFAGQLHGAVSGQIVKDGKLTEGSKAAFDFYMRMSNNPNIGASYMSKYINEDDRSLLETAKTMYDGRLNTEDALLKAYTQLHDPNIDPNRKLERDGAYYGYVQKGVKDEVAKAVGSGSFMAALFGANNFTDADRTEIAKNTSKLESYVHSRAQTYFVQEPNISPEVAVKKAVQDLGKDAIPVPGGIVLGRQDRGQRLDQVMGIEGEDKTTPAKIINDYISKNGEGYWGALWKERQPGVGAWAKSIVSQAFTRTNTWHGIGGDLPHGPDGPPYSVQYNPETKMIGVQLYDNPKRESSVGKVMWLRADVLGSQYVKAERQPGILGNIWDTISRGAAKGINAVGDANVPVTATE